MNETNETLIVEFDLEESDLQKANFWFRLGRWPIRVLLILMPLMGLLLLSRVQISKVFESPPIATVLLVLVVFPLLYPLIIWFQTKRAFGKLQDFQKRIRYVFSADGYKVSDLKSSSDIDWTSILRAAESKNAFHLFFHQSLFHTIPKRFLGPEDMSELRTLLKRSLGRKAEIH